MRNKGCSFFVSHKAAELWRYLSFHPRFEVEAKTHPHCTAFHCRTAISASQPCVVLYRTPHISDTRQTVKNYENTTHSPHTRKIYYTILITAAKYALLQKHTSKPPASARFAYYYTTVAKQDTSHFCFFTDKERLAPKTKTSMVVGVTLSPAAAPWTGAGTTGLATVGAGSLVSHRTPARGGSVRLGRRRTAVLPLAAERIPRAVLSTAKLSCPRPPPPALSLQRRFEPRRIIPASAC